jgi:small nuclear ribonucleoprotein (snRNP)-like protein
VHTKSQSHPPLPMDNLKNFLQFKENQIQANLKNGEPTEAQLNGFAQTMSSEMYQCVLHAPSHVKKICTDGLTAMGWDYKNSVRLETPSMTTGTILAAIDKIQADIDSLSPPVEPTEEELESLTKACNRMWDLDLNRLYPGKDYILNVQGGKKMYNQGDAAHDPLFTMVDARVFEKPTYRAFLALLDNYTAVTGTREVLVLPLTLRHY